MRLLDLFCGGGGAAMGYSRAGFDEIVGVDIAPQPRYPFEFVQADALEFLADHGHEFDAIHASPPCQGYSIMHNLPWLWGREYPLLIKPTRDLMIHVGKPWVLENVMGAKWGCNNLENISRLIGYDITDHGMKANWLCGAMFGKPFYRHRLFESNWFWLAPGHPKHTFKQGMPGAPKPLAAWEQDFEVVHPDESEQAARHPNPVNSEWRRYHDGALNIRPGYEKVPFSMPTIVGRRADGRPKDAKIYLYGVGINHSLATVQGNGAQGNGVGICHAKGWRLAAEAMGIDWMKRDELTQAIPPVFTEFIGRQLLKVL